MLRVKAHETLVQCIHVYLDTVCSCMNTWTRCYRYSEEMASGLMRIRYQTLFSSTLQTWCRDGLLTNSQQWYIQWLLRTTPTCKNILHNRQVTKSLYMKPILTQEGGDAILVPYVQ